MRNIGVKVSYDGSGFNGFQSQPYGRTVQHEIEKAIRHLTGEEIVIIGSGRTDAGVHAMGQVFNFHTASTIPTERWAIALNTRLPKDIVILEAWDVPLEFHSRRSAKRKTYRYSIDLNKFPDVFMRPYRFHHPTKLNIAAMEEGLAYLVGRHDFTSYTSIHSTKPHHIRTIYEASFQMEEGALHMYITGNGFLYNMVRVIMGTLLWVGQGKLKPADMGRILEGKSRSLAGPTAMAHGLTLVDVEYGGWSAPEPLDDHESDIRDEDEE
ncbi:tRNA pseudouridine(38-40) synthase TruA [Paenibacillus sp. PAMC21692]|uniref:tRNA pseudouridine(38-40) synthase TruA n=1 Tax=Paenibacillus sp. PAMC21692 TaxID=2762320 RepID=UPI00164DB217|nr:tRNA pseudouridine(38-40) synthase TruA [Paenibacillus sp. PAMC21692]QNK58512.1 tRNA pseudouridine(38-40) synthase TruA [Paenibacillus sp. PAMC21692]